MNTGKGWRGCGNWKRRQDGRRRVLEWAENLQSSGPLSSFQRTTRREKEGRGGSTAPGAGHTEGAQRPPAQCPPACGVWEDSRLRRRGWLPRGTCKWQLPLRVPWLGAPICPPELDLSPRSREKLPLRPEAPVQLQPHSSRFPQPPWGAALD